MGIGSKLQRLLTERNKKPGTLASETGINKNTIYAIIKRDNKKVDMSTLEAIAENLNVSIDYFFEGENRCENISPLPEGLLPVRKRTIPMIGHVAAGVPIMAEREYEEYEDDMYGVSCDYALRVEGDSMEPRIQDGDIVYVRQQPDVDDGQIAVVGVDDSVTLKVVYHIPGGLQLISLNPKYKPMIYTQNNSDYLAIIGLAVAFKRRL